MEETKNNYSYFDNKDKIKFNYEFKVKFPIQYYVIGEDSNKINDEQKLTISDQVLQGIEQTLLDRDYINIIDLMNDLKEIDFYIKEFEKEIKSEELKSDMEAIIEKYSMESESLVDLKEKVLANELTVEAFEKEVAFLYATSHLAIKSYSRESKNNEVIIQKNNKNKSMSEYGDVEKYLK